MFPVCPYSMTRGCCLKWWVNIPTSRRGVCTKPAYISVLVRGRWLITMTNCHWRCERCLLQQLMRLMSLRRSRKVASTAAGQSGRHAARLVAMMPCRNEFGVYCQSTVNCVRHVAPHCDSDGECVPTYRHATLPDARSVFSSLRNKLMRFQTTDGRKCSGTVEEHSES